jgi:hypothetical protein
VSDWVTSAIARAEKRADWTGKFVAGSLKVLLVLIFVGVIVLLVPGIMSSGKPALWLLISLAVATAMSNLLAIIDRIAPNNASRRYERPFRWIASTVRDKSRRRKLGRIFALQGTAEVAARVLPAEDAAHFTISRQRRRRLKSLGAIVVIAMAVFAVLASYLRGSGNNEPQRAAVWQPFHLGARFEVTAQGQPTCAPRTADSHTALCTVVLSFTNISHEDQDIGAGSFGSIGPEGSTFYQYQDYAVVIVSGDDYFTLVDAGFQSNALKAGETTKATLTFAVRDGINKVDELVLEIHGAQGQYRVAFG